MGRREKREGGEGRAGERERANKKAGVESGREGEVISASHVA